MKKVIIVVLTLVVCAVLLVFCNTGDTLINCSANLGTNTYYNIAAANNIFSNSPVISSDERNSGIVQIRILDDKGQLIGSVKTISPGESVTMDEVPALSGTYTIQGKADISGAYIFDIDKMR